VITAVLVLAGCGIQPYHGSRVGESTFLQRSIIQEKGPLRVTAAVPDAEETKALTGLDLYQQGIQPVWLKVENTGSAPARTALWSIDRNYFSPIEVAYMNRKQFSSGGYDQMQRWFYENRLQRFVPAGESRSGLVFTHLKPGTKGFNLDVFSSRVSYSFTFFVPMPGFTADYTQVDFAALYDQGEIRQLDPAGLKILLEEEVPCCSEGPNEGDQGGPLNVALVGTPLALRRALLRGGWQETEAESEETRRARAHLFRGRAADAIFQIERKDGDERIALLLWRAPWDVDGEAGWIGMVFFTVFDKGLLLQLKTGRSIRDSKLLSAFVKESVSADLDGAQRFLLQNFWYNQSLAKLGVVTGVGQSTVENPLISFDGVGYYTDGNRDVLFLSETPIALDKVEMLYGQDFLRAGMKK
jgi:hypothetical protein